MSSPSADPHAGRRDAVGQALAWVPPVVPLLVLVFIMAGAIALMAEDANVRIVFALAALISGGGLGVVASQWARHGDGVRDWLHGGVAYVDRDDPTQLGWVDWAVVVTRRGRIHDRAARLRLETRLFWGLVPLSSREIKLSSADRAAATHGERMYVKRLVGPVVPWDDGADGSLNPVVSRARLRSDHVVELTNPEALSVRLLDLSTRTSGSIHPGYSFVEMLARRINQRLDAIDWAARPESRRPPPSSGTGGGRQ
jgi:hypothetical protein